MALLSLVVLAFVATNHAYKLESRIVNGEKAVLGQFPYYAFLHVKSSVGSTACGASLIKDEWLLTAAHCLTDAYSVGVHLGGIRVDLNSPTMEVGANRLYTHPEYIQIMALNDIGELKLIIT